MDVTIGHRDKAFVGNLPFEVTTLDASVDWLLDDVVRHRVALNVRLANAYCVALADKDAKYSELLNLSGVNLPDGSPVVWFLNRRRRGGVRAQRVRGPSLFIEALRRSSQTGVRHFFLGSTDKTLGLLIAEVGGRFPDLEVAGSFSPPFGPVTDEFIRVCAEQVNRTGADIVWVGLGTPKQDIVGTELAALLGCPTVSVGAAFDFTAGVTKEAPQWVQQSGFEWLYRLATEPRRLWRRYLFGNARFLVAATLKTNRNVNRSSA